MNKGPPTQHTGQSPVCRVGGPLPSGCNTSKIRPTSAVRAEPPGGPMTNTSRALLFGQRELLPSTHPLQLPSCFMIPVACSLLPSLCYLLPTTCCLLLAIYSSCPTTCYLLTASCDLLPTPEYLAQGEMMVARSDVRCVASNEGPPPPNTQDRVLCAE